MARVNPGADIMKGGAGHDRYVVDNPGDMIVEDAKAGYDRVETSLSSYTLEANADKLVFTGGSATGNGNGLANSILGSVGDDTLNGLGGNDDIWGNAGNDLINGGSGNDNDTLNGGAGVDTTAGGTGDDYYLVQTYRDIVIENADSGVDTIDSVVNYVLPDNVEKLFISGIATFAGGNALANEIRDNTAASPTTVKLDGGGGSDTLYGGAGVNIFLFKAGEANGDTVIGFDGKGDAAGDSLVFRGYGSDAQFVVGSGTLSISYSGGIDVIHVDTSSLVASDYSFV